MEPNVSEKELASIDDSLIILNEAEFLENIYRRYNRIRLDTMIECFELMYKCTNKSAALCLLRGQIHRLVPRVTENYEEMSDVYNKMLKLGKRGNPRRTKVGL
jgi:hypothetical protein